MTYMMTERCPICSQQLTKRKIPRGARDGKQCRDGLTPMVWSNGAYCEPQSIDKS